MGVATNGKKGLKRSHARQRGEMRITITTKKTMTMTMRKKRKMRRKTKKRIQNSRGDVE
jgi:hypothetical protein